MAQQTRADPRPDLGPAYKRCIPPSLPPPAYQHGLTSTHPAAAAYELSLITVRFRTRASSRFFSVCSRSDGRVHAFGRLRGAPNSGAEAGLAEDVEDGVLFPVPEPASGSALLGLRRASMAARRRARSSAIVVTGSWNGRMGEWEWYNGETGDDDTARLVEWRLLDVSVRGLGREYFLHVAMWLGLVQ